VSLTRVDFSNNSLEGSLPTELGRLSQLRVLTLRANLTLTGEIPLEYTRLTKLEELDLAENRFVGELGWRRPWCT